MTLLTPQDLYTPESDKPGFQLLDVRAPIEVARGAMPFSNFEPILTTEERHQVGLCYKEKGQEAAITLGYALTEPYMAARVGIWKHLCDAAPTAVMCWRGGLRSKLTTEFIGNPEVPRVEGGYKALRHYLMEKLESVVSSKQLLILSGLTGSGKTRLLRTTKENPQFFLLDLEAEAHHRGSAFGKQGQQPPQATFENHLAAKLLLSSQKTVLLEDESRAIGGVWIPEVLFKAMGSAPLIMLETALPERIQNIFDEYVREPSESQGIEATLNKLENNILRLYQRLGWGTTQACVDSLHEAANNGTWFNAWVHSMWIETLLTQYYDPLYNKSLNQYQRPVMFRGDYLACQSFLETQLAKTRG